MGVMYFNKLDGGCVAEDYTIFIGASWNYKSKSKNGAAAYMLIDRRGNNEVHVNNRIVDTNVIRMLLLSIWSGLKNIPDNKTVRVVTNNNAVIQTLNEKNIGSYVCSDLKTHIVDELSRLKSAWASRPLSATDESYLNEMSKCAEDGRAEYERKQH